MALELKFERSAGLGYTDTGDEMGRALYRGIPGTKA